MFVACSTLCFAREPLEKALRLIAELEFDKFELAIVEDGQHLRPSEVADDPEGAMQRVRHGPSLSPSSIHLDFGPVDWSDPASHRRFEALCRFAKAQSVAVLTMPGASLGHTAGTGSQKTVIARLHRHARRTGTDLAHDRR